MRPTEGRCSQIWRRSRNWICQYSSREWKGFQKFSPRWELNPTRVSDWQGGLLPVTFQAFNIDEEQIGCSHYHITDRERFYKTFYEDRQDEAVGEVWSLNHLQQIQTPTFSLTETETPYNILTFIRCISWVLNLEGCSFENSFL